MEENRQHYLKLCQNGRIHMVGIASSSISGLAVMLRDLGYQVTGSCDRPSDKADELTKKGINMTLAGIEGVSLAENGHP